MQKKCESGITKSFKSIILYINNFKSMKKYLFMIAAVVLLAIVLSVLAANVGVFFGTIAWIVAQGLLYLAQKALSPSGEYKSFPLRGATRLFIWTAMWLLMGAVGTLISLINQNFGGEPLASNLAGAIFVYPIQIGACIWLMKAAYLALKWNEKDMMKI